MGTDLRPFGKQIVPKSLEHAVQVHLKIFTSKCMNIKTARYTPSVSQDNYKLEAFKHHYENVDFNAFMKRSFIVPILQDRWIFDPNSGSKSVDLYFFFFKDNKVHNIPYSLG